MAEINDEIELEKCLNFRKIASLIGKNPNSFKQCNLSQKNRKAMQPVFDALNKFIEGNNQKRLQSYDSFTNFA